MNNTDEMRRNLDASYPTKIKYILPQVRRKGKKDSNNPMHCSIPMKLKKEIRGAQKFVCLYCGETMWRRIGE